MGQDWVIFNLDLLEPLDHIGKLGESLWNFHQELVALLCSPSVQRPRPARLRDDANRLDEKIHRSAKGFATFHHILHIPELIIVIFEHIDFFWDRLAFGCSCGDVWMTGESLIIKRYLDYHAEWQGCRLICLGNYVRDLPATINNDHDLSRMQEKLDMPDAAAWFKDRNPGALSAVECRRTLPKRYFGDLEDDDIKEEWNDRLTILTRALYAYARRACVWPRSITEYWAHGRRLATFRPHYPPNMDAWFNGPNVDRTNYYFASHDASNTPTSVDSSVASSDRYAGERVMVLLNISKGVYVRSDALAVKGNDPVWGFGRAIMSRICWSSDPSTSMAWQGDITRGVWAGDEFFVVPLSELEEVEGDDPVWEDVSDEVREEMLAIMESDFSHPSWE